MGSLMNQVFYTDTYDLSIVSLIVAVFAVAIVAWVVWELAQVILRHMIGKKYSVHVPFSVRVGLNRRHSSDGFSMGYPSWQAAKKDGTRDLRTNNKRIVRIPTVIFLGGWRLSVKNPFVAYDLVNGLRDAGHDMGLSPEEQWKLRCLTERERARSEATSIDGIVNRFRDHPTDFEPFCADLFRTLGWRAETTPPSRDGGFDLRMISPEGETYIAECKCYSPRHHVGRPVVQKLHGANAVEQAHGMMLVTTSSFSQDAVDYAAQAGVELVDGSALVGLCRRAWGGQPTTIIPERSARMTRAELMSRIPADMRSRYLKYARTK